MNAKPRIPEEEPLSKDTCRSTVSQSQGKKKEKRKDLIYGPERPHESRSRLMGRALSNLPAFTCV